MFQMRQLMQQHLPPLRRVEAGFQRDHILPAHAVKKGRLHALFDADSNFVIHADQHFHRFQFRKQRSIPAVRQRLEFPFFVCSFM